MIVTYEEISTILTKIGPELEVDEIAAYEESRTWAVATSDGGWDAVILLHYDEASRKLFVSGDCGPVPDDKVLSTYEFLLKYNLACIDTGGARFALDGPGGDISLIFDLPLADLEADTLSVTIGNFINLLRTMQAMVICGFGEDPSVQGDVNVVDGMTDRMQGAIRA
ncbi:MAG: type III secretion system chaperone [Pseudomonadota bacterium]